MMPRLTAVVTARVTLEAVDMALLLLTVLGLQCHQFGHPACFITRAAASSDNSMDTLATLSCARPGRCGVPSTDTLHCHRSAQLLTLNSPVCLRRFISIAESVMKTG